MIRDALDRARALGRRLSRRFPVAGETVAEFRRIEVLDRSVVVAAQALLALIPLVVVLVAFLPSDLTRTGIDRFAGLTGLDRAATDLVSSTGGVPRPGADVRSRVGVVSGAVIVLSASSFARAVLRAYEKVWDLPRTIGVRTRARALGWLLCWLAALQGVVLCSWLARDAGVPVLARLALDAVLLAALWWWSLRVLLGGRVAWRRLALSAALTGPALVAYCVGASAVLPAHVVAVVHRFGAFGLVLGVATWLIGISAVVVASATLGRIADRVLVDRRRADRERAEGRRGSPRRPSDRS